MMGFTTNCIIPKFQIREEVNTCTETLFLVLLNLHSPVRSKLRSGTHFFIIKETKPLGL